MAWKRKYGTKYNNHKVEYDGRMFDSEIERDRYIVLKDYEKKGIIENLQCQVPYSITPKVKYYKPKQLKTKVRYDERELFDATDYKADFEYTYEGEKIVEDVKGMVLPEFKIKRKVLFHLYGVYINLVFKPNAPLGTNPLLSRPV